MAGEIGDQQMLKVADSLFNGKYAPCSRDSAAIEINRPIRLSGAFKMSCDLNAGQVKIGRMDFSQSLGYLAMQQPPAQATQACVRHLSLIHISMPQPPYQLSGS